MRNIWYRTLPAAAAGAVALVLAITPPIAAQVTQQEKILAPKEAPAAPELQKRKAGTGLSAALCPDALKSCQKRLNKLQDEYTALYSQIESLKSEKNSLELQPFCAPQTGLAWFVPSEGAYWAGNTIDCRPYRCREPYDRKFACLSTCGSAVDCQPGHHCNADGHCCYYVANSNGGASEVCP